MSNAWHACEHGVFYDLDAEDWPECCDHLHVVKVADNKRPPCPRCAEWDAVPVGNGPKRSSALKAMGRSFAVHTCGLEADK